MDPDGIESLNIELQNASGNYIQDLSSTVSDDIYTIPVDSSGFAAGDYVISYTVSGVVTGQGNFSQR